MAHALADSVAVAGTTEVSDVLDSERECSDVEAWATSPCMMVVGKQLTASFVLGGRLTEERGRFTLALRLIRASSGQIVWKKGFALTGTFEKFHAQLTPALRTAFPYSAMRRTTAPSEIEVDDEVVGTPDQPAPAEPPETASAAATVPDEPPPAPRVEPPADLGLVKALTIGAAGYFAAGSTRKEQSPGGLMLTGVYPTGKRSQVRIKAGIPLFRNSASDGDFSRKYPDPYLSVEHDWAWKYFGVTGGVSYMQLAGFTRENVTEYTDNYYVYDPYYYYDSYGYGRYTATETYKSTPALNATIGFRGGKPTGGFIGRFSWPLGLTMQGDEPRNIFIEYSALGVFGMRGGRLKFGMGVMGMHKWREPKPSSITRSDTVAVTDAEYQARDIVTPHSTNEFYLMAPVLRMATLVRQRVVVSAAIELGGTLIPRMLFTGEATDEEYNWWKPSIGLAVVYSFGTLTGAHLFDGTF
jgi:hypothetical protein